MPSYRLLPALLFILSLIIVVGQEASVGTTDDHVSPSPFMSSKSDQLEAPEVNEASSQFIQQVQAPGPQEDMSNVLGSLALKTATSTAGIMSSEEVDSSSTSSPSAFPSSVSTIGAATQAAFIPPSDSVDCLLAFAPKSSARKYKGRIAILWNTGSQEICCEICRSSGGACKSWWQGKNSKLCFLHKYP